MWTVWRGVIRAVYWQAENRNRMKTKMEHFNIKHLHNQMPQKGKICTFNSHLSTGLINM